MPASPDSRMGDSLCGPCAPQWRFLERHGRVSSVFAEDLRFRLQENLSRGWPEKCVSLCAQKCVASYASAVSAVPSGSKTTPTIGVGAGGVLKPFGLRTQVFTLLNIIKDPKELLFM